MKRRLRITLVLPLLVLAACADATLQKVAKDLDIVAHTVGAVQTAVLDANRQMLFSDASTRAILESCLKVNLAGQQAVAYTRTISQLDAVSREQLIVIMRPAIYAAGNLVQNGTLGITDAPTQQKIQLLLSTLQATLNGIQIAIAGGGQ